MKMVCDTCGSDASYSHKYDAFYCRSCNKWLETKCEDPECAYCASRPERPRDETKKT